MPRLPFPFEDVFETGPLAIPDVSAIPTPKLDHIVGAKIFAPDGAYLGRISRDRYDSESIGNSYGEYGSRYSATSIFNTYGEYGGPYGRYSPFNSYSTEPPRVMINDRVIGYLTKNQYIANRIDPEELTAWVSAA
jgi:hypothetical protein